MTGNAAQVRGDIQRGITGDKRAGFDPAAAPLETDAEAAGTRPRPDEVAMARSRTAQARPGHAADSYENAMLPLADARPRRGLSPYVLILVAFIAAVLAGAIIAAGMR